LGPIGIERSPQAMAKKQNGDGGLGLIIVVLAVLGAAILTAAIYIPPIALLLALLYFEFRAPRTPKNFSLTDEEKHQLSEFERYLRAIAVNVHRIEEEGSELKQNLDGSYHRGSRLGMQLNKEKVELDALKGELIEREYAILKRSNTTFNEFARVLAFRFALRWTTVAYVLIVAILYALNPAFINSISKFVGQHVLIRISSIQESLYGSVLASALVSSILLWALYKISHRAMEAHAEALGACMGDFQNPARDMSEFCDKHFEAIAESASRYENGTYYDYEESEDEEDDMEEEVPAEWHETLGVSPNASASEINAAWRQKLTRNHPDRVAELDPEFQALAEERTKRLNAAREEGLNRYRRTG
jgi:hypothetical protein